MSYMIFSSVYNSNKKQKAVASAVFLEIFYDQSRKKTQDQAPVLISIFYVVQLVGC